MMQSLHSLEEIDKQLIDMAIVELRKKCKEPLQTVVAITRTKSGKIYSAVNLYHFTGGPCAEGVLMANTLFNEDPFETIVAVHYDNNSNPEIINPCGRCRQMFNDYQPDVNMIVDENGQAAKVGIPDLLPYVYHNKVSEYRRVTGEENNEG